MKRLLSSLCAALLVVSTTFAESKQGNTNSKLEQDKAAIRSMAGCYKVTFQFGETFAPDSSYKYHDRKIEWGIELVIPVEETDKKISFQHLLLVSDDMIIKHWRQDWEYENTSILAFQKDNTWKKQTISAAAAKGTWTQKVFSVDDSPRYEGFGTWNHVDGRNFWESTADAPLPRREYTTRSDYNVLKRHSRMEITDYGWVLEQDNEKIIRTDKEDKLLCMEKGYEKFTRGDNNCKSGEDWWKKHHQYWDDVRLVWKDVYAKNSVLKLQNKVADQSLYEQLFAADDKYAAAEKYDSKAAQDEARKIIESFIIH